MGPKSAASTKGRGPSKSPAPKSRDKKADSKKGDTSRSKSPGPSKKTKVEDKKKSGANENGKVAESKEAKDDTKETCCCVETTKSGFSMETRVGVACATLRGGGRLWSQQPRHGSHQ